MRAALRIRYRISVKVGRVRVWVVEPCLLSAASSLKRTTMSPVSHMIPCALFGLIVGSMVLVTDVHAWHPTFIIVVSAPWTTNSRALEQLILTGQLQTNVPQMAQVVVLHTLHAQADLPSIRGRPG